MSIELNDPKLTAYALGELDDADRGEVERFLETSAEAQDVVAQIRDTADALEREFAAESDECLTDEQRQRIEATILASKLRRWLPRAVAASIVLAVAGVTASMYLPRLSRARELSGRTVLAHNERVRMIESEIAAIDGDSKGDAISESHTKYHPGLAALGDMSAGVDSRAKREDSAPPPSVRDRDLAFSVNVAVDSKDAERLAMAGWAGDTDDAYTNRVGHGDLWLDKRADKDGSGEIPWHKDIKYPPDWPEITAHRKGVEERGDDSVSVWAHPQSHSVMIKASPEVINAIEGVVEEPDPDDDGVHDQDPWWTRRRQPDPHYRQTGEDYARIYDNPFKPVLQDPLSTFSIDVDTGSYSNVRRMLTSGHLPPPDAVRIEEMVNYFSYDYAPPTGEHPFAVHLEEAACPWAEGHRLVRIGLKGREIDRERRPACNLVFLIDVSGSMSPANKLPLLKQAMALLTNQLSPEDRVGIVVYAGESGVALNSTPASNKSAILSAIENLESGGSTNGGAGIEAAYGIATSHFIDGGVNRVILATDGDFNVGVTERGELIRLIEEKAKSGVFLSVLGFGMGNLKDATLEQLADKGNGHYAYIDTFREAKKVLVDDIAATLVPIAKDVKIQIEFNPTQVASYRLIGYENRVMAAKDFNDDTKDAGEIGAGHTVTALYELVPAAMSLAGVDPLKYQQAAAAVGARKDSRTSEPVTDDGAAADELLTVKLRYKQPDGDVSTLIEAPLSASERSFDSASDDLRLAASVAGFGMLLRCSPHKGDLKFDAAIQMAVGALGADPEGRRSELVDLMRKAKSLRGY